MHGEESVGGTRSVSGDSPQVDADKVLVMQPAKVAAHIKTTCGTQQLVPHISLSNPSLLAGPKCIKHTAAPPSNWYSNSSINSLVAVLGTLACTRSVSTTHHTLIAPRPADSPQRKPWCATRPPHEPNGHMCPLGHPIVCDRPEPKARLRTGEAPVAQPQTRTAGHTTCANTPLTCS